MDIKKQPKPWYIRYRYPILSGAAGIAILVYALFLIVTSGIRRVDMDSVVIAEVKKAPFWEYVDVEGLVHPYKTIQVNAMENGFVERVVAEEGAMLRRAIPSWCFRIRNSIILSMMSRMHGAVSFATVRNRKLR